MSEQEQSIYAKVAEYREFQEAIANVHKMFDTIKQGSLDDW